MGYLGTKPSNIAVTTQQISDGAVTTAKIADANVSQAKLGSNVAGNGPAFSAYCNQSQTLSANTWTKLTYNEEEFDTNNNYDNTTNYRFTPTVAGYYQVNGQLQPAISYCGGALAIYKNGSSIKFGNYAVATTFGGWTVSALVYLNGSTDYIELYGNMTTGQLVVGGLSGFCYFQASMVRGV